MRDIIIATPASDRILVAEDDAVIMRIVTAILENEGYRVVTAHDGREAFKILHTDADFVGAIFDMHMPYLKGLDIIDYMQTEKRLKRIPVLMMTAERDLTLCSAMFAAGAALFLQKPFTPTQMKTVLRLLVGKGAFPVKKKTDLQKGSGMDGIKRALETYR